MLTYCLFCETAKCGAVARAAERKLGCRAIAPKQVQHTWSRGQMVDIVHDLLPGYVFLYAKEAPLEIAAIRALDGVIRCLYTEGVGYALQGSDEQFALMLLQKNGVIGKTRVYEEGQMIRIARGAFEGVEAKILKVNRRNMRMQIELPFAAQKVKTWVEYEVVAEEDEQNDGA